MDTKKSLLIQELKSLVYLLENSNRDHPTPFVIGRVARIRKFLSQFIDHALATMGEMENEDEG